MHLLSLALLLAAPAPATSAYTDLDLNRCTVLSQIEEGASTSWRCPGYGGVPLVVLSGDDRWDLDAGIDNERWESPMEFSTPPRRVEWRLRNGRPFAIIFRLSLTNEDRGARTVLIVETLGRPGAPGCQILTVEGSVRHANAVARREADARAATFRCGEDGADHILRIEG